VVDYKKHVARAFYFAKMSKNDLLPKSIKKFIRLEKARIRVAFFDFKKQEEMIRELYSKFIINRSDAKTSVGSQEIEASLNPKSETLNPKQIQNPKSKIQKNKKIKS